EAAAPAIACTSGLYRRDSVFLLYQSKTISVLLLKRVASKPIFVDLLASHPPRGFPKMERKNPSWGAFCVPNISYQELPRALPNTVNALLGNTGSSFPILPQLPLILRSLTQVTFFIKLSSDILHPNEKAGKLPNLLGSRNLDEPSL